MTDDIEPTEDLPLPRNARLFVAFRVLFNARFYYPVLAVLFVDLGLTMEQYALLNVAWAAAIVVCELPLGALGDQIGRKPLVVGAAVIMVIEMCVLGFAPTGDSTLLFWVLLGNRVLSGMAEAAASGVDEALAYDSLADAGRSAEWPRVLRWLGQWRSGAMAFAMIVGGLVYDPSVTGFDQSTTARFPIYLTLVLAVGALITALRLREIRPQEALPSVRENARAIGRAGRWIAASRFALVIILFGLAADTSVRIVLTFNSAYLRWIHIPEAFFGFASAGTSLLGILAAPIAERRVARHGPLANYSLSLGMILVGLVGIATVDSWWGIVFLIPMSLAMRFGAFFDSEYLNRAVSSAQRATVLSFRSLAYNLGYGAAGWAFAVAMRSIAGGSAPPSGSPQESQTFIDALAWIPPGFVLFCVPVLIFALRVPELRERTRP
jgi:predicted MFS family arabinose efflux permease